MKKKKPVAGGGECSGHYFISHAILPPPSAKCANITAAVAVQRNTPVLSLGRQKKNNEIGKYGWQALVVRDELREGLGEDKLNSPWVERNFKRGGSWFSSDYILSATPPDRLYICIFLHRSEAVPRS
jgi:hypothetical protein